MNIIGIDTSCDDTCVAILKIANRKLKTLSSVVSSQVEVHQKYGGVYPTLAKREHQRNLGLALKRALKGAKLLKQNSKIKTSAFVLRALRAEQKLKEILNREKVLHKELKKFLERYQRPKIDVIAVTVGPGLEPCLWVGVNFARALSYFWEKPIIPVNHLESHILANWLGNQSLINNYLFPAICLVVSGGHTQLILMRDIGKYKLIGETRDDAAGECFDKTARILGLGYPGGPAIAAAAVKAYRGQTLVNLPRPMINSQDYDFSFSGLKTAVLYDYKKRTKKIRTSREYIRKMAREIQQAIIDVLVKKTIKASRDYKAKTIILGGGVAANNELRKQFNNQLPVINHQLNFLAPPKNLCTDNAAMVGAAAYFHLKNKKSWKQIQANANIVINNQ